MTLRFPLTNRDEYKAKVRFSLQKAVPGNISAGSSGPPGTEESVDNNLLSGMFGEGIIESLTDVFTGTIKPGKYVPTGEAVELYLPGGVQTQDGVEFDNQDLNLRGAAMLQGFRNNDVSVTGAVGQALNPIGSINAIREAFGNNREQIATAAVVGLAQKAPQSARTAVTAGLMRVPNPNTRSLFKGVPIRQFEFSFKLLHLCETAATKS